MSCPGGSEQSSQSHGLGQAQTILKNQPALAQAKTVLTTILIIPYLYSNLGSTACTSLYRVFPNFETPLLFFCVADACPSVQYLVVKHMAYGGRAWHGGTIAPGHHVVVFGNKQ